MKNIVVVGGAGVSAESLQRSLARIGVIKVVQPEMVVDLPAAHAPGVPSMTSAITGQVLPVLDRKADEAAQSKAWRKRERREARNVENERRQGREPEPEMAECSCGAQGEVNYDDREGVRGYYCGGPHSGCCP